MCRRRPNGRIRRGRSADRRPRRLLSNAVRPVRRRIKSRQARLWRASVSVSALALEAAALVDEAAAKKCRIMTVIGDRQTPTAGRSLSFAIDDGWRVVTGRLDG